MPHEYCRLMLLEILLRGVQFSPPVVKDHHFSHVFARPFFWGYFFPTSCRTASFQKLKKLGRNRETNKHQHDSKRKTWRIMSDTPLLGCQQRRMKYEMQRFLAERIRSLHNAGRVSCRRQTRTQLFLAITPSLPPPPFPPSEISFSTESSRWSASSNPCLPC